ncbi:MAG: MOSC domain-containing protein [Chromatiales bacterium]
MQLTQLRIYPVKSLRGISLTEADIDARGLQWDRHWMLVDGEGKFMSQRRLPAMALISTAFAADGVTLSANGHADLLLPFENSSTQHMPVEIWQDKLDAPLVGQYADDWLRAVLDADVHLVSMPTDQVRPVDPDFAATTDQTGFSDGFPFLLIGQASLDDLNNRLDEPLPMTRFRPNLVVDTAEAFAEDNWQLIRIGDVEFRVVKPCSRCIITTVNPDTGERGAEPLKTLGRYRRHDNKVFFGQNLIHNSTGHLRVCDAVQVLA